MELNQLFGQRHRLKQETIRLALGKLSITVVANPDECLEEFSKQETDGTLRLPYWAYLWPSSIGLAHHLDRMDLLAGLRVLEIGCGFGLAGLAASQGGGNVLFTDYERDALLFARYNAWRNSCLAGTAFLQMDWNAPCLNGQFERILAADVVYEEKNWDPILSLIQTHLAPDGTAIISEPNRSNAHGFLDLLNRCGFTSEEFGYTTLLEEDPTTVAVYSVQRVR